MALDSEIPSREGRKPKYPIADWARQRRKVLGLSQSDVAARMSKLANTHVDANYLALIERGRIEAPRKHLRAFALALETTEDEVLRNAGIIPVDESAKGGSSGINPHAPGTSQHQLVEASRTLDDITAQRLLEHLEFLLGHPLYEERDEEREDVVSIVSGAASGSHRRSG